MLPAHIMRGCTFFLLSSVLLACSSSTPTESPGPKPDETPPEAPPAPTACGAGTYMNGETSKCEPFPSLGVARSAVEVAPIRDHHSTIILETSGGPFLYVLGGTDAWNSIHD